ncbi:MAG TPA: hypothetical protein VED41_10285, partial [Solirubrobacteraceae bacterium]|nr:hypothetical protein [Solirubrobacteraceae bacterium]
MRSDRPSRKTRRRGGLLLATALATLVVCTAWATASPTPPGHVAMAAPHTLLQGVNIPSIGAYASTREIDQTIAQAQALHSTIVRTTVAWSVLEPRAPGQLEAHELAETDRLVADAATAGIRVLMTVDSTPCWASSAPAQLLRGCSPAAASQANAWPPRDPAAYAAFVAYLAQRYGT